MQQSILIALSSHLDKYHLIKFKNEQIILYSNGIYNNIYIPDCVPITELKLIETTEHCYAEIPIQFKIINTTKIGFLTPSLIIKDTSIITLCNHTNDYTILPRSLRIIERKNGIINILQQTNENLFKISFLSLSSNLINYQHNIQITEHYISITTNNSNKKNRFCFENNRRWSKNFIKIILIFNHC